MRGHPDSACARVRARLCAHQGLCLCLHLEGAGVAMSRRGRSSCHPPVCASLGVRLRLCAARHVLPPHPTPVTRRRHAGYTCLPSQSRAVNPAGGPQPVPPALMLPGGAAGGPPQWVRHSAHLPRARLPGLTITAIGVVCYAGYAPAAAALTASTSASGGGSSSKVAAVGGSRSSGTGTATSGRAAAAAAAAAGSSGSGATAGAAAFVAYVGGLVVCCCWSGQAYSLAAFFVFPLLAMCWTGRAGECAMVGFALGTLPGTAWHPRRGHLGNPGGQRARMPMA